jgi:alpha-glucosidase
VSEGRYRGAEVKGLGDVPVHIRGGWIIPLRVQGANTTAALRRNNFELVVAPGEDGTAKGELYLDDGETLDVGDEMSVIYFSWDDRVFDATGVFGYETSLVVESVLVLSDGVQQARRRLGPWGLRAPFKTEV